MVNQQTLEGKWNEVKGMIKQKWGKLSDDDLRSFNGNVDQLIGKIQNKTGESREAIEQFLGQCAEDGSQIVANVRDRVQQGAAQVAETARQGAAQITENAKQGYAEAERLVQERPGQSLAVAFGLGLVAGLGVAVLMRDRSYQETALHRGRNAAEHLGRQLVDSISQMLPQNRG